MNNKYKRNIALLFAIVFLQGFVFYGPIATLYRESRGISLSEIFLIESISWLVMMALEVPFGWFADRYGYKRTLVVAHGVFFVSKIVFFMAHSFSSFLLERLLLSVTFAGLSGCDSALLYASADEKSRDKVYSHYNAVATAGFLIASVLTTVMISSPLDAASVDRVGFLTLIPYGIAFALSFFIIETPKSTESRPRLRSSLKKALGMPALIALVIAVALSREIYQAVTVFLNQAQYLRSGIDVKWFGLLLVLLQIGNLTAAKAHRLSDRLGQHKALLGLLLLMPLATLLLYFTDHPVLSIVGMLVLAMATSFISPIAMSLQNQKLDNVDRATVLSIFAMMGETVAACVNPAIGWAADLSLTTALLFCVGIGFVSVALFGWATYNTKKEGRL